MKPKILLGLTTTKKSDWRGKVKEVDELGLTEIALFLTCLEVGKRKELYKLLEKTNLKEIPVVHLRDDFEEWEFAYLIKRFKTKFFNTHFDRVDEKFFAESKGYLKKIYLENHIDFSDDTFYLLDIFAGLCLDVSHWHDYNQIQKLGNYKKFLEILKKYKIGFCHISAMREKPFSKIKNKRKVKYYHSHWLRDLSELNYVKKYVKYLPRFCAIELENPLKRQLEAKKYLEKIISRK